MPDLVEEARKRYQEKQDWSQRVARAQSVYRETDITRLTEIFVRAASQAVDGFAFEKLSLENLKVGSSAIITKLLQLRQTNLGVKEVSYSCQTQTLLMVTILGLT